MLIEVDSVKDNKIILAFDTMEAKTEFLKKLLKFRKKELEKVGQSEYAIRALKCSGCGGIIKLCEICRKTIVEHSDVVCSDEIKTEDCKHAHKKCFDENCVQELE